MGVTQRLGTIPLAIFTDASNNIGIGGSPSGSYKFEVTGTGYISGILTGGARIQAQGSNGAGSAQGGFLINYNANASSRSWLINNDQEAFGDFAIRTSTTQTGSTYTTRLYINPSGNVGIGTSSPSVILTIATPSGASESLRLICADAIGDGYISFYRSTGVRKTYFGYGGSNDDNFSLMQEENAALILGTNGVERFRITATGYVGIGTSSPNDKFVVQGASNVWAAKFISNNGQSDAFGVQIFAGSTSSDTAFRILNAATTSEYFKVRGDGYMSSVPTYNNTYSNAANVYVGSDGFMGRSTSSLKYKDNVLDYNKGLAEVMQLRPVSYTSKNIQEKGQTFAGLIAEEVHDLGLTEFVQYAEDGTPDSLAYTHMIALLTKAIQELNAKVSALENKS